MNFKAASLLLIVCIKPIFSIDDANVSMSIAGGMQMLLKTEYQLTDTLESYAEELQIKIDIIRRGVDEMRRENSKGHLDPEKYLSNPLHSFPLIRRLQADWIHWELFMTKSVGGDQIKAIQQNLSALPTKMFYDETVSGIYRIKKTYDLDPSDLASGMLNGKQYDAKLTSLDCYTIGRYLLEDGKEIEAGSWLKVALKLYKESEIHAALGFSKLAIQELYADALRQQRRLKDALSTIDAALEDNPYNARLLRSKGRIELLDRIGDNKPKPHPSSGSTPWPCRGELPNRNPKLHCRYNMTTSPFLKLAPLKMEEIELDPYIVLYHDVISSNEIDELKKISRPNLQRAQVFSYALQTKSISQKRTADVFWISNNESTVVDRLQQRVVDMTGFVVSGSEDLQVSNYGLGGHFDLHPDFVNASSVNDTFVRKAGDRIATVLFYLNDVEQGGETIFPSFKISVVPLKGTAVMWHNLENSGEGDMRTLHMGCPVLVGSKWVANQWIREYNQMFRKPCYR